MQNRFQTLGAGAFALVAITVSIATVQKYAAPESALHTLIPTIGDSSSLYGQTGQSAIPINDFSPAEAAEGITLAKDEHNFFRCTTGGSVSSAVDGDENIRMWSYEFVGTEPPFTGRFFFSEAELAITPQFATLNTLDFYEENQRYYFMTEQDVFFRCGEGVSLAEEAAVCGDGIIGGDESCDDENTANGDGCSDVCQPEVGYTCTNEPSTCSLLIPTLPVDDEDDGDGETDDWQSYIRIIDTGSSTSAVANQADVSFLRFSARASEEEDLFLTQAAFEAAQGSLNNAINYTLWVDTDDQAYVDQILQTNVTVPQNGNVLFAELAGGGYVIPAGEEVIFEVHADIASSTISDVLQLKFVDNVVGFDSVAMETLADGAQLDGIRPIGGECIEPTGCDIILDSRESIVVRLSRQGDLFVTKDSSPVRARQLLGGTVGDTVLRLQFRAGGEDIDVTDIRFTIDGDAGSIDRLNLYREGEDEPFAAATPVGCQGTDYGFCANMESAQLVVQDGTEMDVLIRPIIKSDAQGGGRTGHRFTVLLDGSDSVEARGADSTNAIGSNDADNTAEGEVFIGASTPGPNQPISGLQNRVVMSKFRSIVNANPNADNSLVPVGPSAIGQFKFEAHPNANENNGANKAKLQKIIFTVNSTNVAMDANGFRFYNKADAAQTVACEPYYLSGEAFTAATISSSFAVLCELSAIDDRDIAQNTSETFVLEANISNVAMNASKTSELQVEFKSFSNPAETFGITGSHIQWSDSDAVTQATFYWIEYPETQVSSTQYVSPSQE